MSTATTFDIVHYLFTSSTFLPMNALNEAMMYPATRPRRKIEPVLSRYLPPQAYLRKGTLLSACLEDPEGSVEEDGLGTFKPGFDSGDFSIVELVE